MKERILTMKVRERDAKSDPKLSAHRKEEKLEKEKKTPARIAQEGRPIKRRSWRFTTEKERRIV